MRPAEQTFRAMPTRTSGRPPLLSFAACAPAAAPGLAAPNLVGAHAQNGAPKQACSRRADLAPGRSPNSLHLASQSLIGSGLIRIRIVIEQQARVRRTCAWVAAAVHE
jgi:hypothetical protein